MCALIAYAYLTKKSDAPTALSENAATTTTELTEPPRFEEYTSEVVPPPRNPVGVNWSSDPNAQMFKTAIEKGLLTGPVFGGRYAIASWGCGTSCQGNAIIDALTGDVVVFGLPSAYGLGYQLESSLLVVNPPGSLPDADTGGAITTDYYVMEGGMLRLLQRRNIYGKVIACAGSGGFYKNPHTNVVSRFSTSCEVPFGYVKVDAQESGVTGSVSLGPVCPVEVEGQPCTASPEAYAARSVVLLDAGGASEIAITRIQADGTYRMVAPPGNYILDIVRTGIDRSRELPKKITIAEGEMLTVDFSIDTGIR